MTVCVYVSMCVGECLFCDEHVPVWVFHSGNCSQTYGRGGGWEGEDWELEVERGREGWRRVEGGGEWCMRMAVGVGEGVKGEERSEIRVSLIYSWHVSHVSQSVPVSV